MKRLIFILMWMCTMSLSAQYEAKYTVVSVDSVIVSGVVPAGSTVTFKNPTVSDDGRTVSRANLNENKVRLQLLGYDNMQVEKVRLRMRSDAYSGEGGLAIWVNGVEMYKILSTTKFNSTDWNGAFSTKYVDIEKDITDTVVDAGTGRITVNIFGGMDTLYIESYTIFYSNPNGVQLDSPTNIAVTDITENSAKVTWDEVQNAGEYRIYCTNLATMAVDTIRVESDSVVIDELIHGSNYSVAVGAISKNYLYSHSEMSTTTNFMTTIIPPKKVSLEAGLGTSQAEVREMVFGSGVLLPIATLPQELRVDWEFLGWTEAPLSIESTAKPEYYEAGSTYYPEDDITLYALYESVDEFGVRDTVDSTSYANPNEGWRVKSSSEELGAKKSWLICENDTIFTPEYNGEYIDYIDVNIKRYKTNISFDFSIENNGEVLSSILLTDSVRRTVRIDIKREVEGPITLVSKLNYNVFGVSVMSVSVYGEMPVKRYYHGIKQVLDFPRMIVMTSANEMEVYWTAVDSAKTYTIMLNDVEYMNVDHHTHYCKIEGVDVDTRYKVGIESKLACGERVSSSVVDTSLITSNTNVFKLTSGESATESKPTVVNVSSIDVDNICVGENVELYIDEDRVFRSVEISSNAKVVVPRGVELNVDRLVLQSNNDKVPQIDIKGTLNSTMGVEFRKEIDDNSKYLFFSIPFDCPVSYIRSGDEAELGEYGVEWLISRYDEHIRATEYEKISRGEVNSWLDLNMEDTLYANVGYIAVVEERENFVFPQTKDTEQSICAQETIFLKATEPKESTEYSKSQTGWNLICVPDYQNYTSRISFIENEIENMPISFPAENGKDYVQGMSGSMILPPFRSFFVQVPKDGDLRFYHDSSENIPSDNLDTLYKPIVVSLFKNNELEDIATISFNENMREDYTVGYDLEKLSSFSDVAQVYILEHNMKLAVDARERLPMDTIDVALYIPEVGEYTLRLLDEINASILDNKSEMETCKSLTITDLDVGYTEGRIKILVDRVPVGEDVVIDDIIEVNDVEEAISISNLAIGSVLYLYTTDGKLIMRKEVTSSESLLSNLEAGVYILKVVNGQDVKTKKVLVRMR